MRRTRYPLLLVMAATLGFLGCSAFAREDNTPPKRIRVVGDRTYAPYEYLEDGKPKGLLVDLWTKWSEKTGVEMSYLLDDWKESQEKVKRGEAEAVGGIMRDAEREKYYDFIRPVMTIDEFVFYREADVKGAKFSDFADLVNYEVGIVDEDEAVRLYRTRVPNPRKQPRLYRSYADLVKAAVHGEVSVFLMEQPVARYWLDQYDKQRAFVRATEPLFHQKQYIAVRKGNVGAAKLINEGFNQISRSDIDKIRDKWEGYRIDVEDDNVAEIAWRWIYNNATVVASAGYLVGFTLVWAVIYWWRPRYLLIANRAMRKVEIPLPNFEFLKGLGSKPAGLVTLATWWEFMPRVLDDWIRSRESQITTAFENLATVRKSGPYYVVPMEVDGEAIDDANSKDREDRLAARLAAIFDASRAVVIAGEGGLGKTSLACWIGARAIRDSSANNPDKSRPRIFPHPIIPILLDSDFTKGASLFSIVHAKIADMVAEEIVEDQVRAMIRANRLLVIVDGFTERQSPTQQTLRELDPRLRFRRMVMTSRSIEPLGQMPLAIVIPQRLAGSAIANFLQVYVKQSLDNERFYAACVRISRLTRNAMVTPLFVALYGRMLLQTPSRIRNEKPPRNVPELIIAYIIAVNDSILPAKRAASEVLTAAKVACWVCMLPDFIPGERDKASLLSSPSSRQMSLDADWVVYLEQRIQVLVHAGGDMVKISQDPVAEYLAAMFLVEHGDQPDDPTDPAAKARWLMFLELAESAHEKMLGFLSALRDVLNNGVRRPSTIPGVDARLAAILERVGRDADAVDHHGVARTGAAKQPTPL